MSEAQSVFAIPSDQNQWAVAAHLAAFSAFIFPLGTIVGPLAVYLMKKGQSYFVDKHAKASLNYHVTQAILILLALLLVYFCFGLSAIVSTTTKVSWPVNVMDFGFSALGFILVGAYGIFVLIETVLNAVRASNGEDPFYRAFTYRFVK